jgi:NTP pyrophosphatase (non-canonical NTP hydrolase)
MKLSEYVELACVTESVVGDVEGLNGRLLHGMIGMCTEAGEVLDALKRHVYYVKDDGTRKELDEVNLLEEVGDLCWYLAIITDVLDLKFEKNVEDAMTFNDDKESRTLLSIAAELNAVCGGNLVTMTTQGHPHLIQPLFFLVDELIIELDGKWEEVCEKNIAKLKERHGEKYSAHGVYNRDLEAEREILAG